ncbi:CopG family ribbon-helix-helix protein [Novosphingobium sp. 17-62-19]|uniref:CopG family ribbon-helix-helix protein n=1 Tax=Novosphingobium sp. 17-62-19 TaxID=1970406 RepID=UPI0025ED3A4F|nr:CopG family ribbon-helix-helix protein [Novosphingobium sp. 17-62-19]
MSLPASLFRKLDMMVDERRLPSRSQLIAELIRHALAAHEAYTRPEETLAGTITVIYRGDRGRVRHQLAQTQAQYLKEVISSQHVFLQDDQSLEVLLVQGAAVRVIMRAAWAALWWKPCRCCHLWLQTCLKAFLPMMLCGKRLLRKADMQAESWRAGAACG